MPTALERLGAMLPRCNRLSWRELQRLIYCTFFGILKGVIMAPIIIPLHILGCIAISLLMVFTLIDQGYFTLRFTKLFGFNLKCILALLLPIAVLVFDAVAIVASAFFALAYVFAYPVFVTLHARQQTGYRYSYLYSGWWETWDVSMSNLQAYWGFLSVWVIGHMRVARTAPRGAKPYDIHPWNYLLALFVYTLGWILTTIALELIVLVKLAPIILRAYVNHFVAAPAYGPFPWSKNWKWWFSPMWWFAIPLLPVAAVLLLPGAMVYGSYVSATAAADTVKARGALGPAFVRLRDAVARGHKETTRYILRQDVPFLELPASSPVSLPWLLVGVLPALAAIIVVPALSLLVAMVSLVPVISASFSKATNLLCYSNKGAKPYMVPLLVLFIIALPAIVPIALILVVLYTLLLAPRAMLVTHSSRSLTAGLRYIPGLVYRTEYALNKFAYAYTPSEQVHWASCFPPSWALYAQPFMDAREFERSDSAIPASVVGVPIRYVPRGMRKPKIDAATGVVIDMTGAGYIVPGVGFSQVGPNGLMQPVGMGRTEGPHAGSVDGDGSEGLHGDDGGSMRGFLGRYYSASSIGGSSSLRTVPVPVAATAASASGASKTSAPSPTGASAPPRVSAFAGTLAALTTVVAPSGVCCACLAAYPDEEPGPEDRPSTHGRPVSPAKGPSGAGGTAATVLSRTSTSRGPNGGSSSSSSAYGASGGTHSPSSSSGGGGSSASGPPTIFNLGAGPEGSSEDSERSGPHAFGGATLELSLQQQQQQQRVGGGEEDEVLPPEPTQQSGSSSSSSGLPRGGSSSTTTTTTTGSSSGGSVLLAPGPPSFSASATPVSHLPPQSEARTKAAAALSRAQEALTRAAAARTQPPQPGSVTLTPSIRVETVKSSTQSSAATSAAPRRGAAGTSSGAIAEQLEPYIAPASRAHTAAVQQQQSANAAVSDTATPSPTVVAPLLRGNSGGPRTLPTGAHSVISEADQETDEDGASSRGGRQDDFDEEEGDHRRPSVAGAGAPMRGSSAAVEEGGDEEEDDEEDDVFVLQPITRPELPDTWVVATASDGDTYYINYARGQSTWNLPPGIA